MKLVLFDCDGTLVDSVRRIHETFRRTFIAFNYPAPSLEDVKSIVGLSLDISFARLLGRETVDEEAMAMRLHFKSLFAEIHADPAMTEQLFPGISELVDALARRDDVIIGAVTGNSRRGLNHILSLHGFSAHFRVSRTADDCPSKPDPAMVLECCAELDFNPAQTLVIGDAVFDMQMAKAAGADAIGVAWGYGTVDALKSAGADMTVGSPEDILNYI
ncbi:HAD-IA family hydrolase [Martelella alba]|uniref:HAD-IA family hydrolase n=1 Tax=Martelella alba TaxID=2590451 RepID=A0A506UIG7_9HYPH|nr:HAD-IA family hydrolase [Martelella alba]TPW33134.1 HAD-IA family hydrolase [Martelella alba]